MELVPYSPKWKDRIEELFVAAVSSCFEYTERERMAWSFSVYCETFHKRWNTTDAVLAVEGEALLGFGNIAGDYIDTLFVAPDLHGKGIGSAILAELEARGKFPVFVHASKSAYSFFLSHGYMEISENTVERKGEKLINYLMCKPLNPENK